MTSPPGWLGPLRPPARAARGFVSAADVLARPGAWLVPLAAASGALPLLVARVTGGAWHGAVSALLVTALLVAATGARRPWLALLVLVAAFTAHSVVALAIATGAAASASLFPGAADYWERQQRWIATGEDPELALAVWLPEHAITAGGVAAIGYPSFGGLVLVEGFRQVDLMNYYVGRLLAGSRASGVALFFGWHPWSVARGIGGALLLAEVVAVSVERFTATDRPPATGRRARLVAALAFFLLDAALKLALLDTVQRQLAANLSR